MSKPKTMYIDIVIRDPNVTKTGIVWRGTLLQWMTKVESKRLGTPEELLNITFTDGADPNQLVIIRRVFPDKDKEEK